MRERAENSRVIYSYGQAGLNFVKRLRVTNECQRYALSFCMLIFDTKHRWITQKRKRWGDSQKRVGKEGTSKERNLTFCSPLNVTTVLKHWNTLLTPRARPKYTKRDLVDPLCWNIWISVYLYHNAVFDTHLYSNLPELPKWVGQSMALNRIMTKYQYSNSWLFHESETK